MCRLIVRSITFFTQRVSTKIDVEGEISLAEDTYSIVNDIAKDYGFDVFSWRISFPGINEELASFIPESFMRDKLVSVGYQRKVDSESIISLVESGFYVPLLHTGDHGFDRFMFYSKIIHRLSSANPLYATRVSIGFHDIDFQTPYFPDSSSRGTRSIGLSFIYPQCLVTESLNTLNASFSDVFKLMNSFANSVEKATKVNVVVDYSLSPWMNNSVAEVLAKTGFNLLEPGALHAIRALNESIASNMDRSKAVGFNEVMLPYAEDNLLKRYGEKGLIRARDFLLFASVCVAGVDMIVVPEDESKLARLVADAEALARVKNRALSLRAIPVPNKPGDELPLGRFGSVTVIPL